MGATRTGRWRTGVLVLVHVLMAVHILLWVVMGSTVSPVEPSESMQTLELGLINAGAVLFALALLSTLVFGRFFCGWLCHVVALQDACAWMMNRIGIRPKPFRSRLLVFAPLVLGFYMFIWPNFKRFAVAPALEAAGVGWPVWLRPVVPFDAWQSDMIVSDFWATFPAWYIAVPFLLVCGFVTVYFLGAKGFCTYACPYGGLFAPADTVAPLRIRVTDACEQCGYCTSVCTSNVRVSEEVNDFGMVVDPGCMKCLDCIEACPNDALYLGLGAPALGKKARDKEGRARHAAKARRRYDMTWGEEIVAAVIFVAVFLATRGMLDQVPMLLAGGVAAIVTFVLMTAWWVLARDNARLYGLTLKHKGRVRAAGVGFVLVSLVLAGVVVWAGQARYPRWRADMAYTRATIPAGYVVKPEYAPGAASLARAQRGAAWLAAADGFDRGGRGWKLNAEHRMRQAYFLAVLGRLDEAADALDRVIEEGSPGDGLISQLVRLRTATGADEAAIDRVYERALELHPNLHHIRLELAMRAFGAGDVERAEAYFPLDDAGLMEELGYRLAAVSFWQQTGRNDVALPLLEEAAGMAAAEKRFAAGWLADLSGAAMRMGERELALSLIEQAVDAKGSHPGVYFAAAEVAATFGDAAGAIGRIEEGLRARGGDTVASLSRAGGLLMRLGEGDRGFALYQEAVAESTQPFEKAQLGMVMARAGMGMRFDPMVEAGVAAMEEAGAESGEPMIWHDLAPVLYQLGRNGEAADAIVRAAELAPGSVVMAERASELCAMVGDTGRAEVWAAEAERRAAGGDGG